MNKKDLTPLFSEAMQALNPHYGPSMQAAVIAEGLTGATWFTLVRVRVMDPEPFTMAHMLTMAPYAAPDQWTERFAGLVEQGYLAADGDAFRLTEAGHKALDRTFHAAQQGLAGVEPLPAGKMARLVDLLATVVGSIEQAEEPASKLNFLSNRRADPGPDAPPAARIDQYITDITLLRDDAHTAAWQRYGVDGPTWELFSYIWQGDFPGGVERLDQRGYADKVDEALAALTDKGWITSEGEAASDAGYQTTEAGQRLRDEAETETDRLFYAPWEALSQAEIEELAELLKSFNSGLNALAEKRERADSQVVKDLWPLLIAIPTSARPIYGDKVRAVLEETGLNEPGFFFTVWSAGGMGEKTLTPARQRERFPYTSAATLTARYAAVAEKGFLDKVGAPDGADDYRVTEAGRAAFNKVNAVFYGELGEIEALPSDQLAELVGLLGRAAAACRFAPEPPPRTNITRANNTDPGDVPPLGQVDFQLDLLNAYRDDCHIAAWGAHDISGEAWEAFAQVADGQAQTAAELAEKLSFRGHDEAAYAAALADVAGRGWLARNGDKYTVTAAGKAIREAVEADTDYFFYRPWLRRLSMDEIGRMRDLATQAVERLKKLAEAAPPPA